MPAGQMPDPRGLPTAEAASYVGLSVPIFKKIAAQYRIRPLFTGRRQKVYERRQLDDLLDRLSGRVDHHTFRRMTDREAEAEALRRLDERAHALRHVWTAPYLQGFV